MKIFVLNCYKCSLKSLLFRLSNLSYNPIKLRGMRDVDRLLAEEEARMSEDILSGSSSAFIQTDNPQVIHIDYDEIDIRMGNIIFNLDYKPEAETPDSLRNDQSQKVPETKGKRIKKASAWKSHKDFVVDPNAYTKTKSYKKKPRQRNQLQGKAQYPTKNFLQNFKGAHENFLRSRIPQRELIKIPIYRKISSKNNMSMRSYVELYEVPEFCSIFEEMFACKHLYRAMMLSRNELKAKKDHCKKIEIFERVFKTKSFTNIN